MHGRWLVVSNCQATGLANCLGLLLGVQIDRYGLQSFFDNEDHVAQLLPEYAHVVVHPEALQSTKIDFRSMTNVTCVPDVIFSALHPDLTYVLGRDELVQGPLSDYHSAIAVTAYKLGLSQEQAKSLFSVKLYDRLGFFDLWETEKSSLLSRFHQYDLDISRDFVRWSRMGSFMYSLNHPKVYVLKDIATNIVRRIVGPSAAYSSILPHDNLSQAPAFPVYPEIAERYGVRDGSYLFRVDRAYRTIDLETMIASSYAAYTDYEPHELIARGPAFEQAVEAYLESA